MSETNWPVLLRRGVLAEAATDKGDVAISGLDLWIAIKIAHALTISLDEGYSTYKEDENFSLEEVELEATKRADIGEITIMEETRPAFRNYMVKIERLKRNLGFTVLAEVRNDYQEMPELCGGDILQRTVNQTVEALEL